MDISKIQAVVDSQWFWGVVGLVLAAIAVTGKLSISASIIVLLGAWLVGCYGIYTLFALRTWYTILGCCLLWGSALAFLAAWLQPALPVGNDERRAPLTKLTSELEKLIDAAVKEKLDSLKSSEPPPVIVTHVIEDDRVLLTVSVMRSDNFDGAVNCTVTDPKNNLYSAWIISGVAVSGLKATREYPRDFQNAPPLASGKYYVVCQLASNKQIVATDEFEIL